MTEKRRQEIYGSVFSTMLVYNAIALPLDVEQLCKNMGIELRPLSQIIEDTGLTKDEVFDIWGNKDGSANAYKTHKVIAYNDFQIQGRVRFTICEEIFHSILFWDIQKIRVFAFSVRNMKRIHINSMRKKQEQEQGLFYASRNTFLQPLVRCHQAIWSSCVISQVSAQL